MIVKDPANAARLAPVRQKKIGIRPRFELAVIARVMRIAGALHGGVKGHRVRRIGAALLRQHRRQVGAAAEPALRVDRNRVFMCTVGTRGLRGCMIRLMLVET